MLVTSVQKLAFRWLELLLLLDGLYILVVSNRLQLQCTLQNASEDISMYMFIYLENTQIRYFWQRQLTLQNAHTILLIDMMLFQCFKPWSSLAWHFSRASHYVKFARYSNIHGRHVMCTAIYNHCVCMIYIRTGVQLYIYIALCEALEDQEGEVLLQNPP